MGKTIEDIHLRSHVHFQTVAAKVTSFSHDLHLYTPRRGWRPSSESEDRGDRMREIPGSAVEMDREI